MPFKSQAQRRKFAQLMVEGKISPQTFEEWNRETGSAELPEHASRRPKKKTATKSRRTAAKKTRATSARKKTPRKTTARKTARKKTARKKRAG
jgi:hypothetical protein